MAAILLFFIREHVIIGIVIGKTKKREKISYKGKGLIMNRESETFT